MKRIPGTTHKYVYMDSKQPQKIYVHVCIAYGLYIALRAFLSSNPTPPNYAEIIQLLLLILFLI